MKRHENKFSLIFTPLLVGIFAACIFVENSDAARAAVSRNTPVSSARKSIANAKSTTDEPTNPETTEAADESETAVETEIIADKSDMFSVAVSGATSDKSGSETNELFEQIRRQRAASDTRDSATEFAEKQKRALASGQNACDMGLRKCMQNVCGTDFLKCVTDGDTIMGDKFNKCRRDIECTGEEFRLFTTEIKADMELNAKLSSFNKIIDCGNSYNTCLVSECGETYSKCLGKKTEDAAKQKCESIAKSCMEQDSGLSARFGTAIGLLRQNAEKEVKADEERMYKLRDLMSDQCHMLGAAFDERSFDCVYTVNFFTGANTKAPMASRKRYAGDTFVCMQEWFGIDTTTFKENAYRETRAQTAASSAMLGSGLGTAAGLISSGAIGRAVETQKAKKELKKEKDAQGITAAEKAEKQAEKEQKKADKKAEKEQKKAEKAEAKADGKECSCGVGGCKGTYSNGKCSSVSCSNDKYTPNSKGTACILKSTQELGNKIKANNDKIKAKLNTKKE